MWIVQPLQIANPDGTPTGKWRLTARSDEDGGGPYGLCDHEHLTAEEAQECTDAIQREGQVTGVPRISRQPSNEDIERIAEAIANDRAVRRGCPHCDNVLKTLPDKVADEIRKDAAAALLSIRKP